MNFITEILTSKMVINKHFLVFIWVSPCFQEQEIPKKLTGNKKNYVITEEFSPLYLYHIVAVPLEKNDLTLFRF